jgi:Domain of unknown function (DUF4326)
MPPNTLKVDRSTRWGNPMRAREGYTPAQAVSDYRLWVTGADASNFDDEFGAAPTLAEIRFSLAGRNLACWCRIGQPCHADILLEIANQE